LQKAKKCAKRRHETFTWYCLKYVYT
jgi:hypothetical protein